MYRRFGSSPLPPAHVVLPGFSLQRIDMSAPYKHQSDVEELHKAAGFHSDLVATESLGIAVTYETEGLMGIVTTRRGLNHNTGEQSVHITNLAVAERYRGKCVVGGALVKFAIEDDQYKDIHLVRVSSTVRAQRFYERLGFRSDGSRMILQANKATVIDAATAQLAQRQLMQRFAVG